MGEVAVKARPKLGKAARGLKTISVLVNPLSGSVGPAAPEQLEAMLAEYGLKAEIHLVDPQDMDGCVSAALSNDPDLLIVLAGDGTARAAASHCGAKGPLVAPLPGGTMNMLPHAIYGVVDWKTALHAALSKGIERPISGGEVDGKPFYVAAILGAPTLWAYAREAMRKHQIVAAWDRAQDALRRAFQGHLKFRLDGGPMQSARALSIVCPLVSKAMNDNARSLEAAAVHPQGAAEAFRLGFRYLASPVMGDWRDDPAVDVTRCRLVTAHASGRIPAILDGEPERLPRRAEIRFKQNAFRVLAPDRPSAVKAPAKAR